MVFNDEVRTQAGKDGSLHVNVAASEPRASVAGEIKRPLAQVEPFLDFPVLRADIDFQCRFLLQETGSKVLILLVRDELPFGVFWRRKLNQKIIQLLCNAQMFALTIFQSGFVRLRLRLADFVQMADSKIFELLGDG